MASSIGEVLDIESPYSYIKRPTGPMVTVEVKDISKLAGIIRIPSMIEGAGPEDTTTQRILYSGLPNQCRKCRNFGHLARTCPRNRFPTLNGSTLPKPYPERQEMKEQMEIPGAPRWNTVKARGKEGQHGKEGPRPTKWIPSKTGGSERTTPHPEKPQHKSSKKLPPRGEEEKKKKDLAPPSSTHPHPPDQEMGEQVTTLTYRLETMQQDLSALPTPMFSPRTRMLFVNANLEIPQVKEKSIGSNPFVGNPEEAAKTTSQLKRPEGPEEGWIFQGKKKKLGMLVRIHSPRQEPAKPTDYSPQPALTPGGKRGQTHSELHHSYFDSLGIPMPEGQEFCKAWIWPVLSREKNERIQILLHARNQLLPDLPLSMRITGPPEDRWTQNSAQTDLTLRLEAELEKKVLRYKMAIRENLHLEWCWREEPRKGGLECTILAHIRTSPALSIQNKRHLHWKDIESITDLNNEAGAVATAHSLLLKRDPPNPEHHTHKQKIASLLASPQAAGKKRFRRLEWGNEEANPPTGANPFQTSQMAKSLSQPNTEPNQGQIKGSFGRQTALTLPANV